MREEDPTRFHVQPMGTSFMSSLRGQDAAEGLLGLALAACSGRASDLTGGEEAISIKRNRQINKQKGNRREGDTKNCRQLWLQIF